MTPLFEKSFVCALLLSTSLLAGCEACLHPAWHSAPEAQDPMTYVGGVWVGELQLTAWVLGPEGVDPVEVPAQESSASDFWLWFEHSAAGIGGRAQTTWDELPDQTLSVPSVSQWLAPDAQCDLQAVEIEEDLLTVEVADEHGMLLLHLFYDEVEETLRGDWEVLTGLVRARGTAFLQRRAYLAAARSARDCIDRLACARWPAPACADRVDNDGDGLIDAADRGCSIHRSYYWPSAASVIEQPFCWQRAERSATSCDDGVDNDGDGDVDGHDLECITGPLELGADHQCTDGVDNDGNGLTDRDDPGCDGHRLRESPGICEDGLDNDGDGAVDAEDADCEIFGMFGQAESTEVSRCSNLFDDDGDGLVDLQDPGCLGYPTRNDEGSGSWSGDACMDGVDNDGDGDIDGADADCGELEIAGTEYRIGGGGTPAGETDNCDDGTDNNGDGLTDLEDPLCRASYSGAEAPRGHIRNPLEALFCRTSPCGIVSGSIGAADLYQRRQPEACGDGTDNDGDGWTDQLDPGCVVWPHLFESTPPCLDGVDNDADGRVDADDPGCRDPLARSELELHECQDGQDNDTDGYIDSGDEGCGLAHGDREWIPACSDGLDNDQDGRVDHVDPGCGSAFDNDEASLCADSYDNDGDLLIDLADPGCAGDPDRDSEHG